MGQNPSITAPVSLLSMGCNLQKKNSAVWDSHGLQFLLWNWLSVGYSGNICSNMVFHELQGNFCSGDRLTPPPGNSVTLMLFLSHFPQTFPHRWCTFFFFTLYPIFYHRGATNMADRLSLTSADPFCSCSELVLSDIKTVPSVFSEKSLLHIPHYRNVPCNPENTIDSKSVLSLCFSSLFLWRHPGCKV